MSIKNKAELAEKLLGSYLDAPDTMPSIQEIYETIPTRLSPVLLSSLKTMNYISEPIQYVSNIPQVFRWDARPPEVIMEKGFEGAGKLYFNSIFGRKTVFSAADIIGSDGFFKELSSGIFKCQESRTFYLYKINSNGLPAVPVYEKDTNFGFSKQLATRSPWHRYSEIEKEYGMPPIRELTRASNYISTIASINHEVQLCGPIHPSRINYIEQRSF